MKRQLLVVTLASFFSIGCSERSADSTLCQAERTGASANASSPQESKIAQNHFELFKKKLEQDLQPVTKRTLYYEALYKAREPFYTKKADLEYTRNVKRVFSVIMLTLSGLSSWFSWRSYCNYSNETPGSLRKQNNLTEAGAGAIGALGFLVMGLPELKPAFFKGKVERDTEKYIRELENDVAGLGQYSFNNAPNNAPSAS